MATVAKRTTAKAMITVSVSGFPDVSVPFRDGRRAIATYLERIEGKPAHALAGACIKFGNDWLRLSKDGHYSCPYFDTAKTLGEIPRVTPKNTFCALKDGRTEVEAALQKFALSKGDAALVLSLHDKSLYVWIKHGTLGSRTSITSL